MRKIAFAAILGLAGCAAVDNAILGDPAREEAKTPRSIAFCYSSNRSNLATVTERAQAHCKANGLNARQSGSGNCRPAPYLAAVMDSVAFDCVP